MRFLALFFSLYLFAADLIIQYPDLKKEYYENQIINLHIKIISPKETNLSFIPPYGSEINATTSNGLVYDVFIKFKNKENPKLFIIGTNSYKEINLSSLYETKTIEKIPGFCNVLADDLNVTDFIASKYDGKYNMISFHLKTKNGDLSDFNLNFVKDSNLTLSTKENASYLGLIDKNLKIFSFYYYNTSIDNFKKISIPVNIKENVISTQTDLNPEQNSIFTPVNIIVLVLIAFLIIVFLVYQKIWILFFPIALFIILIINNLPKGEVYLERGTEIYILPTKNSTVFYKAPIGTKVKILKRLKHYTKIEINKKIGWVKNEDIK